MTEADDGCRCYVPTKFTADRAARIGRIRELADEYGRQGMNVTVRQIYYQFVARGWAPSGDKTYDQVQSDLNKGRLAGLIPWHYVVDRGRSLRGLKTQASPESAIESVRRTYRLDLWSDQDFRPEVWVEKRALEGVIGDICSADDMRVDYYATGGYDSTSQQYEAGQRMAGYVRSGQRPIVFYLGDHDPSGLDMTRDIGERLELFTGVPVIVQRLALTKPQIEEYDPPPFAVKRRDSRSESYIDEHGHTAWELDALDPSVLKKLIRDAVSRIRDDSLWDSAVTEEVEDLRQFDEIIDNMRRGYEDTED